MMAATLDLPDTDPIAYAMFAHCFTGSRFTPAAARVSKTLAESGVACLRFDFPGLGQSEGDFSKTTFNSNVDDIVAASQWLTEHYSAPQLLIGHSLGGAASLKAATKISCLKAVATIGAPFDPAHAVLHFADRICDVDDQGAVTLQLGGRDVTISREFLEDLAEVNPEDHLRRLRKPLLLLHSPTDQTVGVDNAQLIFRVTRYPKSLMTLDKADHLLTKDGTAQRAARIIANWVEPYLVPENVCEDLPEFVAEALTIKASKYGAAIRTGGHNFITDRDKSQGGKNLGFTPTSLLVSALAAANSQTIKQTAIDNRIKGLDDVKVTISQEQSADHGQIKLRRKISLIGNLSDADSASLRAASNSCSITQLLAQGIVIDDEVN
ncbi:bifunctional alpha/beta hydrolase/OsmC family protein [Corynebacterium glutamicum]|uniref:bifunctional alpha/beta hydrolase/OsmC family protein n=1 Tax=Corynebacterium glutamicum TaxID=1718 RepID=UPI00155E2815|nr:bifunctional alpha/beta hydrolase/OsmC family protein [Corynebacterium glutamicum]